MIKFFRHIRQNLIMENKNSKYLKYAIGEIVLVVIGILIALQINNWNESQKALKKEKIYLVKLSQNIKDDISLLEDIIKTDSIIINDLKKLSEEILTATSIQDINLKTNSRFRYLLFNPNKTTLDNIISSGQIEIIRNDSIVESLLKYYKSVTKYREGIDESLKNYSRDIENFFMNFDHTRNDKILKKKTIEDYRDHPFVLNSFFYKVGLLKYQINNYSLLIKEAKHNLNLIEKELDK